MSNHHLPGMAARWVLFRLFVFVTLVSGCSHTPTDMRISVAPKEPLTGVAVYFDSRFAIEANGDSQVAGFRSPAFAALFERVSPGVFRHNGLRANAFGELPKQVPSEYHVVLRPVKYEYWHGHVRQIVVRSTLHAPNGTELSSWEGFMGLPPAGMSLELQDYIASVENMALVTLNALQSSGYAKLQHSPAQNEKGATNPYLATLR